MTEGGSAKRRKRPSAKEARERMARAVGSQTPISRAEAAPEKAPKGTTSPRARGASRAKLADGRGARETKTAQHGEDGQSPASASTQEPATRLVRLSVDVPADQHRRLRVMAAESGATGMAVVRALLAEMEDDPELTARVRERLAELGR